MVKKPISFGKIDFEIVASMEKARGVPEPETPFRILIMGDFSGRDSRGIFEPGAALSERRLQLVDRDNLDKVLEKLGVEIRLVLLGKGSPPVTLRFSGMDDFHPDNLFESLEVFQALRETRQSLRDPSTVAALAKEYGSKRKTPEPSAPPESMRDSLEGVPGQTEGGLLDQVLDATKGKGPKPEAQRPPSEWDTFLKRIVQPHLVPDIEPQQAEMIAAVDAATSELMRMILHHSDFQEIEAAWRCIHFLISRIETGDELKVYLLDIAKAELKEDLCSKEDLRSTGIYKVLVEQTVETPGAELWALLAGNYAFGGNPRDAELLGRMANIAKAAGAPFIAAGSDKLLGCASLAQTPDPRTWKRITGTEETRTWEALRKLTESSYLGLTLPRFLLRLPYGVATDPIERFAFEEMEAGPVHDHYLWGNPSFACVCLLAQAFNEYGWDLRSGIIQEIGGLPLHVYKEQGESKAKPCAEVVLTEGAAEAILEKGIMPLLSFKNQDTVRLARFQSLADPSTYLAGRWG